LAKFLLKKNIKMHTAANARLNIGVASTNSTLKKHHIKAMATIK
jgi:hypothetical protein